MIDISLVFNFFLQKISTKKDFIRNNSNNIFYNQYFFLRNVIFLDFCIIDDIPFIKILYPER